MKAVVAGPNGTAHVADVPTPTATPGRLLVRVHYVALNPVDWKLLQAFTPVGAVLCKDYSGVVEDVGEGVSGWKKGDRVAGIALGGLVVGEGAAAEYTNVDPGKAWHVPANFPLSKAPTFGIGGTTAALVLYHFLDTPFPPNKVDGEPWLLVSGGSTSVGLILIEYAKMAGYRVVATSGPRNFDLVKSYGADKVVSYHDVPAAVAQIRKLEPVAGAEVAGGSSWNLSNDAVPPGKNIAILEDPTGRAKSVALSWAFKGHEKFDPKILAWVSDFYTRLPDIIAQGIRPGPVEVRKGLEALPEGLVELRLGKVSGYKLIFQVTEDAEQ